MRLNRFAGVLWATGMLAATTAQAQAVGPAPVIRGGMATRSVSRYTDLEHALEAALERHDAAAVHALLDASFTARFSTNVDAVSGPDWLRHVLIAKWPERAVLDLDVRELGDIALVSFTLDRPLGQPAQAADEVLFVVDVWRPSTGTLLARYTDRSAERRGTPRLPTGR